MVKVIGQNSRLCDDNLFFSYGCMLRGDICLHSESPEGSNKYTHNDSCLLLATGF